MGEGEKLWEPGSCTGQPGRQKPIDRGASWGHSACRGQCQGGRGDGISILVSKFSLCFTSLPFHGPDLVWLFFFGCATRLTESESPDQGLNSCPLQWRGRVQTTGPLGNPFVWLFLSKTRGLWIKTGERTSLVVQWIRIHPPMQETQVRSLVWGDVTCHRTTKSVRHSYQAHILEPLSHSYWARELQVLKPVHLERVLCNWRSH